MNRSLGLETSRDDILSRESYGDQTLSRVMVRGLHVLDPSVLNHAENPGNVYHGHRHTSRFDIGRFKANILAYSSRIFPLGFSSLDFQVENQALKSFLTITGRWRLSFSSKFSSYSAKSSRKGKYTYDQDTIPFYSWVKLAVFECGRKALLPASS